MPAPADKPGFPDTGPPKAASSGPEPPPRPAGSGPGDPRPSDATLSPYLRRRLRSLAEALRDSAEQDADASPAPEAGARPAEPGSRTPAEESRQEDRRSGRRKAVVKAFRPSRKSR